jgi:uncharacterized protein YaiE (UPF0345 family)
MSVFKTNKLHAVAPILALAIGGFAGSLASADDMVISAGKLAKNAKDYYGRTVTVKAEVEDVIDSHSFTLDEDAILSGPDVLVLVPAGYTGTLAHDQVVLVTGKVRPYVTTELEHDYHWFKDGALVSRDSKVDFKTRPVLVATALRTVDGRDLLAGAAMPMGDHAMMMEGHDHAGMMTMSAGKLAKDGKKYYGQTVTVRAEVEDVLDSHSFTLDEDAVLAGPDVVVLVPAGFDTSTLAHDQVVVVTGKVRPYVMADLEKDYDWFKNGKIVSVENKIDYKMRPVLVAESITTADGRTLISQR